MASTIRSRIPPSAHEQARDALRRWVKPALIGLAVFMLIAAGSTAFALVSGRGGANDVRAQLDGVDPATLDDTDPSPAGADPVPSIRALLTDTQRVGRTPLDRLAASFVYGADPGSRLTGPVPAGQHEQLSAAITRNRTIRPDTVTGTPASRTSAKPGAWAVTLQARTLSGGTATGRATGTTTVQNGQTLTVFDELTWS
ncbi:hypothetical protein GS504_01840 [Rhodococcus hoagii]|nr:hypothetical protein [Prescottella equi]NKS72234.1 hypothetical protein [Prescottella equi]